MMKKLLTVILLTGLYPTFRGAHAQITLDRPLVLTGQTEDRRISGLHGSVDAADALSATVEQDGAHRTVMPAAASIWEVSLSGLSSAPPAGTHLIAMAPGGSGVVQIQLNGYGPYPLLLGPGEPLDAAEVLIGTPLNLVFDGSAFQITNGATVRRQPCPENMVTVNEEFCISPQENTSATFFEAAVSCGTQGMRLCGWAEFLVACNNAPQLGLTGMTGNWEWIDDAVNEDGAARSSGASACSATSDALVTSPRPYHCCRSR